MKTSAWSVYQGPGRIGISLGLPRRTPAGYRIFKLLAPTRPMLSLPREVYEPMFRAQLSRLDPGKVWDDLHRLAAGAEPVLLCFEKPPFTATNWCHRRMVADWFGDTLGMDVPEYQPEAQVRPQPLLL